MSSLRGISKFLVLFPVLAFLYDLIWGWMVHNKVEFRSLKIWCESLFPDVYAVADEFLAGLFAGWKDMADMPACLVLWIPPAVLYLLYRIIFALRGGRGSGGFKYKSHD